MAFFLSEVLISWGLNCRRQTEANAPKRTKEIWKVVGSLSVPNPVKIFLWRACNNLLPTKSNLFHKRVVKEALCPCCGRDEEDMVHAPLELPNCKRCMGRSFFLFLEMFLRRSNFQAVVPLLHATV